MEQQVPMTEQDWRVLLDRYTDGMFNSASPYRAAALAFKQMVAHAVWEEVRARKQSPRAAS